MYECMWCVNIVLTKQYFLLYWEKTSWWRDLLLQKKKFFKRTYVFFCQMILWVSLMEARVILDYVYMRGPLTRRSSLEKLRNWKRKSPPVSISYGSKSTSWLCQLYEGTPNKKFFSREAKKLKEIISSRVYLL